jgi:hypothetical protein
MIEKIDGSGAERLAVAGSYGRPSQSPPFLHCRPSSRSSILPQQAGHPVDVGLIEQGGTQ